MVAHFGPRPLNRCAFANQQFAEVFGLDEQSIVGMSPRDVVGEVLVEEVNLHVRRLLHERTPVTFTAVTVTNPSLGSLISVSSASATIRWIVSASRSARG